MPLDAQHGWSRSEMVTAEEILTQLSRAFTLTPDPSVRGGAPAETWLVDGGPAKVGVIGSVTRPFCGDCDRTRLTADGQVRNCLFSRTESDLRGPLRAGASDVELADLWRAATRRSCSQTGRCRRSAAEGMAIVTVRYFAGARAAAGVSEEKAVASSVRDLVAQLGSRDDRLARTLAACSFLVDGLAVRELEAPLPELATVDVLPPFAGG
jgi:molybdopterin converting factor small subunit